MKEIFGLFDHYNLTRTSHFFHTTKSLIPLKYINKMSRKRHTINIPGVMLDTIRDNTNYENDERFTKRRKVKGSVLNRKESRKQQRLEKKTNKVEKKNQHKEKFKANIKSQNNSKDRQSTAVTPKMNVKKVHIKESLADSKSSSRRMKSDGGEMKKKQKRVSFSDHDDIREIPAREEATKADIDLDFEKWEQEFASDDEDSDEHSSLSADDSQDEAEENEAYNLIETLKQLKQVQRGEYSAENSENSDDSETEEQLDDEQKGVMEQLAKLKSKKANSSFKDIRIVAEDDLNDDSLSDKVSQEEEESEETSGDDTSNDGEGEGLDFEQIEIMKKLKSLKKGKPNKGRSEIKIVKEDDLDDDEISSEDIAEENEKENEEENEDEQREDEGLDDEQQSIMDQLAALKSKKGPLTSTKNAIRIVKEDDLSDDTEESEASYDYEMEQSSDEGLDEEQDQVMKQLAALKKNNKNTNSSQLKIVKEDELDDETVSSESDFDSGSRSGSDSETFDAPTTSNFKNDDSDVEFYAKKLGINPKKKLTRQDDDDLVGGLFEGLDFMDNYDVEDNQDDEEKSEKKEKKEKKKNNEKKEKKQESSRSSKPVLSEKQRKMLEKDDEEINYYAKKLGINPKKNLPKQGEEDIIGGLFDGINLDFSDEEDEEMDDSKIPSDSESVDEEDDKGELDDHARNYVPENGDDEVGSDDFDDDDELDDDDKALLKEMYGLESSGSDSDSEYDSNDSENDGPRVRENPYVAPVEPGSNEPPLPGSKYIPPALRKKMALGDNSEDSEQLKKLVRLVKGPFNKLSEPNISTVVSELNNLYNDNPRQFVNEAILKVVIQSVCIPTPMLESFLVLYSSAIVAIYKLQGVEFGAFIIQRVVEEFEKDIESESRAKQEIINITGLLGYLYTLNLVSSTLIYDIIKMKLIKNSTELKIDVLLKLIKSCGNKLRTDDSTALNSITLELSKSVKNSEKTGGKVSSRGRFLIDTITDLKNNRMKSSENENTTLMINRLKKQLGAIKNTRNLEPIKVNLDDIENIEERGKWWLVGSAWKGLDLKEGEAVEHEDSIANVNDVLDDAEDDFLGEMEINWLQLAKEYRMNTDIRRAIFISIMSAEDFMDAFMKLEKLNLKKTQKKEIPNILMHCASMESNYNPYYSFLAKKLSDDHAMRRSFQLNLWDFVKELDGDESSTTILSDADDDQRLWKVLNMGRFFGFLIGEGSLSLNVLRVVNFLTASTDAKIFLEILLITMLDTVGKKSESTDASAKKSKDVAFTGKVMADRVAKCDEQPLLIKGLQYFLNNKIRNSELVKGKKQRLRVEWGVDTMSDMLAEMLKGKK